MTTIALAFWCLIFLYPFIGYPLLLRFLLWCRRKEPQSVWSQETPSVALVICAYNERKIIEEKLKNSIALDYAKDRLRIVVISDGSTDGTADVVRAFGDSGIELIEQPSRRGKVRNLNEILPTIGEDIIVLSDANVMYRFDAIRRLIERFGDPFVGCVSGKIVLTDSTEALDQSTSQYYALEWYLQHAASTLYSMPGADGAMYAIRSSLFKRCECDTLIEDFVIPMSVIRQGRRVVLEPEALGWERGSTSLREEFRRKVRIAAGAAQVLLRGYGWPKSAPVIFWFVFISHKLLRWLSPLLGLLILTIAFAFPHLPASQLVIAVFVVAVLLALTRLCTTLEHPLVNGFFYFMFGQIAIAYGLFKGVLGLQTVLWMKADR
jgi:cellulose synthase/poly-beta-1,6-N-acetylglucosamine synthase-like glycosyltransferase